VEEFPFFSNILLHQQHGIQGSIRPLPPDSPRLPTLLANLPSYNRQPRNVVEQVSRVLFVCRLVGRPPLRYFSLRPLAAVMTKVRKRSVDQVLVVVEGEGVESLLLGKDGCDRGLGRRGEKTTTCQFASLIRRPAVGPGERFDGEAKAGSQCQGPRAILSVGNSGRACASSKPPRSTTCPLAHRSHVRKRIPSKAKGGPVWSEEGEQNTTKCSHKGTAKERNSPETNRQSKTVKTIQSGKTKQEEEKQSVNTVGRSTASL
jgi:hypothetical protein